MMDRWIENTSHRFLSFVSVICFIDKRPAARRPDCEQQNEIYIERERARAGHQWALGRVTDPSHFREHVPASWPEQAGEQW